MLLIPRCLTSGNQLMFYFSLRDFCKWGVTPRVIVKFCFSIELNFLTITIAAATVDRVPQYRQEMMSQPFDTRKYVNDLPNPDECANDLIIMQITYLIFIRP